MDSLHNAYLAGFTGSFGAGYYDMCLVKYDSLGTQQWNVTWGGSGDDSCNGVAVDSLDNIYVAGYTSSFGAGSYDMCLVKYNSSTGTQQWNVTWGGSSGDAGLGVAVDSLDNIYVAGSTDSWRDSNDMCLVKYDSSGARLWNVTWGGNGYDRANGVAVDSLDNIYVAGYTSSFGAGSYDMCLVKYNSSTGTQQWNVTWGGSSSDEGNGVAVDSLDNIYVVGSTQSFGAEGSDICLVKHDSSTGARQWNVAWGESNDDYGRCVAVDSLDNIYVTGITDSFGAGGYDLFLVKNLQSYIYLEAFFKAFFTEMFRQGFINAFKRRFMELLNEPMQPPPGIPLGNYYLLFIVIGIVSLIIYKRRDMYIKNS
ncbi:MAG: SBBP repeat-containing protein [Promethearchaeota archaeon]